MSRFGHWLITMVAVRLLIKRFFRLKITITSTEHTPFLRSAYPPRNVRGKCIAQAAQMVIHFMMY